MCAGLAWWRPVVQLIILKSFAKNDSPRNVVRSIFFRPYSPSRKVFPVFFGGMTKEELARIAKYLKMDGKGTKDDICVLLGTLENLQGKKSEYFASLAQANSGSKRVEREPLQWSPVIQTPSKSLKMASSDSPPVPPMPEVTGGDDSDDNMTDMIRRAEI